MIVVLLLNLAHWHPAVSSKYALYDCICSTLVLFLCLCCCPFLLCSPFLFLSCPSVAFSVAFSCILSFAFHISFTLAFVSFSFSFVALSFEFSFAFSFVAFPCHSYFHCLWTIVRPVWGVHQLQLTQCCSCPVVFNDNTSHCRVL